jgi:hypothetical protein
MELKEKIAIVVGTIVIFGILFLPGKSSESKDLATCNTQIKELKVQLEAKDTAEQSRAREPVLSNEQVIEEVRKCEASGLKAQVRLWTSGYGVGDVICFPKYQEHL